MTAPARSRADAVRNAEKVLAAAREVFAERGLGAGIDEVALRAGVGKATVYRCWSTKEELVAAVAGARVEWFTAQVQLAREAEDAFAAFTRLMVSAVESCAQNALLYAGLTEVPQTPELTAQRETCKEALADLVARCQDQGCVHPAVTGAEVMTLLAGVVNTLTREGETDVRAWRRYAELIVAATRS